MLLYTYIEIVWKLENEITQDKWLSMHMEMGYRKILTCINKDLIKNLGRYLHTITQKMV
jgi:hypothetical protein